MTGKPCRLAESGNIAYRSKFLLSALLLCKSKKLSTELCKTVESFVHKEFAPDLSTLFSSLPVEKPVENVDNSLLITDCPALHCWLCQLIFPIAGFSLEYICFLYE
jgi:hypothetical protein